LQNNASSNNKGVSNSFFFRTFAAHFLTTDKFCDQFLLMLAKKTTKKQKKVGALSNNKKKSTTFAPRKSNQ